MSSEYIELHAASAFSFLQGASLPEALAERAAALGYSALALLDRDGVYGAPRFHKAARAVGIRPIIGAELTIANTVSPVEAGADLMADLPASSDHGRLACGGSRRRSPTLRPPASIAQRSWLLPVLCESQEGYRNLCRLITTMKLRAGKGGGALRLDDLDGSTGGLVALAGRPALDTRGFGVAGLLDRLVGVFGRDRLYVEMQRHFRRDEEADNAMLSSMAAAFRVPLLATGGVRFATPAERPLFDVLNCLYHHTTIQQAGRRLVPNAERYLKPPGEMAALFADHPDAVARTHELADRLQYTMADVGYRFPQYPVPAGETQASFLRHLTDVGARDRYRPYHDRARSQVARELDLIEKLDLAGYFLIVWDIVNFCRQHDILVQGRGSAANSAVCYSLGITAVDPVGMDLLFERFLSEERGEWPDIDLDLPSGDRREQVIQYVYDKYGRHGAAMTANVITYRGRSAAREVGKVLGFDEGQVDRLSRSVGALALAAPPGAPRASDAAGDSAALARQLASDGLDPRSRQVELFVQLWQAMQDLPRHLGQHSGGMVICQGHLDAVVPLENASMPGRVVVQWDKDDCADMGIVKVDLLGLGMMAALQEALALVNTPSESGHGEAVGTGLESGTAGRRERLDLAHLPPDDPAVFQMLQSADTVGVFQVESRAQMATLPRLKPACFYDLVVQVAIIRPGPIVGQMVHPYLNRRAGREPVTYPHPSLEPILARTLGVPLFQEQLLRIAMVAAGFSGGQAEELRRAFGFKRSEQRMRHIEGQLRDGMSRQGIGGAAAELIITAISSFALYGFPESHAASFALLAYASAYMKVHYPAAFYTALLNNQPMGFYHPSTLVKDAQRHGVRFRPIDVQVSSWPCTIERDGAIRLGLCYVGGLRRETAERIARAGRDAAVSVSRGSTSERVCCPKCGCDDPSMLDRVEDARHASGGRERRWFCNTCSHDWSVPPPRRFVSLDDLVARCGVRRDELVTLANIGALNAFGHDRREALWQAERAARPAGALFSNVGHRDGPDSPGSPDSADSLDSLDSLDRLDDINSLDRPDRFGRLPGSHDDGRDGDDAECPLPLMTARERAVADYAGTGLTVGPHPMALRRTELATRGVLRAVDLRTAPSGRRVRVGGMVITRQRPGTAKGFVFLTLEDESGLANIIIRPDLFARSRAVILEQAFLIVDGVLQTQDGVTAVRAESVQPLPGDTRDEIAFESHDFY